MAHPSRTACAFVKVALQFPKKAQLGKQRLRFRNAHLRVCSHSMLLQVSDMFVRIRAEVSEIIFEPRIETSGLISNMFKHLSDIA